MPQICQFLGVNSVTNIELPKGFMPALICIFADWLENFSPCEFARELPTSPGHHRVSGRTSYSKVALCP
jgi:hypothetical protein